MKHFIYKKFSLAFNALLTNILFYKELKTYPSYDFQQHQILSLRSILGFPTVFSLSVFQSHPIWVSVSLAMPAKNRKKTQINKSFRQTKFDSN